MVDIPGTYSLMPHSAEEEVARDFICFGRPDAVIVVCDATCLERNLNLVLQTIEITPNVVVCVNLMDEAKRKKIHIDLDTLSKRLGVPVIGTVARKKRSLDRLLHAVETVFEKNAGCQPVRVDYGSQIEQAVEELTPLLIHKFGSTINPRWLALRLLDEDKTLAAPLKDFLKTDIYCDKLITEKLNSVRLKLNRTE